MFLGIDLGSSFIKSALFDLERSRVLDIRKTVTTGFIPHELPHKEIRPEEITSAVQAIIREAAARQELQGIVLSSQMQGLLLKDARGNKLTNFISWQDSRGMERRPDGTSILDRIARTVPAEAMVAGGIQLKSIHSICPLVALLEDGAPRDARVLLLGDVVAEALTGEPSRIDPGMAASSGLYSLQTGEWNLPLLEALGLQHLHLPPIAQGREPLGYFSAAGQRIPIYPAVGDHQAGVLGCELKPGDLLLNISTGSQVTCVDDQIHFGEFETRPFFDGKFLRTLVGFPAGRSVNVLMSFFEQAGQELFGADISGQRIWREVDRLMESADPDGLKVDLSFFDLSGGSIENIRAHNLTVGSLFAAAYRTMVENYLKGYERIHLPGERFQRVVCSGGFVRKAALLKQYIDQAFRMPCAFTRYGEDVLIGLFELSQWFSGARDRVIPQGPAQALEIVQDSGERTT